MIVKRLTINQLILRSMCVTGVFVFILVVVICYNKYRKIENDKINIIKAELFSATNTYYNKLLSLIILQQQGPLDELLDKIKNTENLTEVQLLNEESPLIYRCAEFKDSEQALFNIPTCSYTEKNNLLVIQELRSGGVKLGYLQKLKKISRSYVDQLLSFLELFFVLLFSVVLFCLIFIYWFNKWLTKPLGKLAEYVSTDISKFKKAVLENKVEEIYVLGERFIDARDKLKTYEKLAAIGQTSAMLAHDIRRPFLNVKLILNMLDTYKNNPVALEAAKKEVKKSICNVESMLSDIMDFSREVKLETKPFPLVPLIGSSIKQSIQSYHDANIKFDYNFAHTKQPLVDVVRMERAFCNIIGNAIDAITEFSKANGGTISIFSKDVLSNNGTVLEIIIGNDGPSFEDEDLASMFELFFTKGKKGGTGIGLASTQKIVSLHNGSVKARNRLNKNGDIDGVEFVILIPASGEIEKIN